jgi:hypothetical protein
MSHHIPTAGGILTIIGGVFITLAGLALAVVGAILGALFGFGGTWFFYIGLVVGILIVVVGVLTLVKPEMKTAWGALIIVLAIVSLPTTFGGFVIGFILALIGGILVLTFKPPMMVPVAVPMGYPGQPMGYPGQPMPPPPPMGAPMPSVCPACGGAINPATRSCMACGRTV